VYKPTFRIKTMSPDPSASSSDRFVATIIGPGMESGLSVSVTSEQEAAIIAAALSAAFEYGRTISDVPLQ
jgi:hypothetical protein